MSDTLRSNGRASLRAVALPTEHGGWSLTLEPAILGLIVAFSGSGMALGLAAVLAFAARTPLKVVLVDRWRDRWMARTRVAAHITLVEIVLIVALLAVAVVTAQAAFWWPLTIAAPLIAIELWYDMRSRSRRLIPELAGAVGIASIAAAIALAGGGETRVAAGLWLVTAARSFAAIPFVRVQLLRAKDRDHVVWHSDAAQALAVAISLAGWLADLVPIAAVAALLLQAVFELIAVRRPPQRAALIGAQQVVVGLTVVLITGLAVRAP